jgi:hypothetical protein
MKVVLCHSGAGEFLSWISFVRPKPKHSIQIREARFPLFPLFFPFASLSGLALQVRYHSALVV